MSATETDVEESMCCNAGCGQLQGAETCTISNKMSDHLEALEIWIFSTMIRTVWQKAANKHVLAT